MLKQVQHDAQGEISVSNIQGHPELGSGSIINIESLPQIKTHPDQHHLSIR